MLCSCCRYQGLALAMSDDEDALVEIDYNEIDPGVRETVKFLRANGFDTTDSGDGDHKYHHGEDCACTIPFANVAAVVDDPSELASEADRLVSLLRQLNIIVQPSGWRGADPELFGEPPDWDVNDAVEVDASYDPIQKVAVLLVLYLNDNKLASAGIGKRESN